MALEAVYGDVPKEDKVENKDTQQTEQKQEVNDTPEYNEIEQDAIRKGWKPEGVEGKRNISAEEFLERESLFGRIHKQDKVIKKLESTMDEMTKQHKKIAELERKKVLEELKVKKKDAFENADYTAVLEIDERIDEVKQIKTENISHEVPQQDYVHPDFPEWHSRNQWYNAEVEPELYEEAEVIGQGYAIKHPKASAKEVLDYVEKTVKRLHPDKFERSAPTRRSAVESGQRSSASPRRNADRKPSKKDLSSEQLRVMNRFVSRGVMTEEEYINQLVEIGEL
jgi:uncharacterized protein YbdZ (MbtH family)